MSFLRYLMLLAVVFWLGGLIFFSFVVAPTSFAVLPTRHLAGSVVSRSLTVLHWMGIVSGLVFVLSSLFYSRFTTGSAHLFAARHILIVIMLVLTCISQFAISPRMARLRATAGEIDRLSLNDPVRAEFNALHVWSTRLEGSVLLAGMVLVYATAQSLANR